MRLRNMSVPWRNATVPGDANEDGIVSLVDAEAVAGFYLCNSAEGNQVGNVVINKKNADIDNDGSITINDANRIINICKEK